MNKPLKPQAKQAAASGGLRLPQVEPMRLYRQIAALISDRIDEGLFPVGSLLPAERDLSEQLGVSRTSVREALIALGGEREGLDPGRARRSDSAGDAALGRCRRRR